MKAITIRGIDASVSSKLKQVAKDEKKSVNQLVLDMIKQNIGMQKRKKYTKKYNDLNHLFGKWTDAEFDKVQGIIDSQRKIDRELWE
ncbi:MAG: antitoxin [Deltaproteobacteria bacterium]|jgi:ribosomal protein S24E|nr:antitoxin [Deltaproteobacteria bacterium]